MISLNGLPTLALGIVVAAGIGFLIWTLYRLTLETHSRRSR